jgi:hypothetical protein
VRRLQEMIVPPARAARAGDRRADPLPLPAVAPAQP